MNDYFSFENTSRTLKDGIYLGIKFILFASVIYFLFYIWKKKELLFLKIQLRFPNNKNVLQELKYSFFTVFIFGLLLSPLMWASKYNLTLKYTPIDKYGWFYYFFSIVLVVFIHDTYFYWSHRLLHWKPLYKKIHKVHHHTNPTPFSSYAFHPVEAFIHFLIYPIIVFTIPYHVTVLYIFTVYMMLVNVLGHVGYEFLPKGFTSNKFLKWNNTATHHNMHHTHVKCNYGLYFNIWDRLMKTNHKNYDAFFNEVVEQRNRKNKNIQNTEL